MFGANRDGQGQQYSSPIVTCDERYCIIMYYCNVWTIATFAESAVLQHNAVFAVLQHHACKVSNNCSLI